MSLIFVMNEDNTQITEQRVSNFAQTTVTYMRHMPQWEKCPIWVVTELKTGELAAYVDYEGEYRQVVYDYLPKPILMIILMGAY